MIIGLTWVMIEGFSLRGTSYCETITILQTRIHEHTSCPLCVHGSTFPKNLWLHQLRMPHVCGSVCTSCRSVGIAFQISRIGRLLLFLEIIVLQFNIMYFFTMQYERDMCLGGKITMTAFEVILLTCYAWFFSHFMRINMDLWLNVS